MTRRIATFIAAAALCGAAASPARAAGPDAMVVVGNAGAFSCPPGSGDVVIAGVGDLGNHWTFTFSYANASQVGCLNAGGGVATGTWNPSSGGCVSGVGGVCIGAVASPLTPTTVSITVCIPAICYSGSGIATRL